MVYLIGLAVLIGAVALWKLSSRPDPHHIFFVSLLPLLDLEHKTGTHCDWNELTGKPRSRAA